MADRIKTLFCSPRHVYTAEQSPLNCPTVGAPTVLDGMDTTGMGGGPVSNTPGYLPELNLCIWECNLTQDQIDTLNANPDCYVFNEFRLQQGDTSGFVQWLKDRGINKGQFQKEFAKMSFKPKHNNIKQLGSVVLSNMPE